MPIQFDRVVAVEIGTPNTTGRRFESANNGLRITFDVQMTDSSTPNSARIEMFGASQGTVARLQETDAIVRLLVGYSSQHGVPRLIFTGNPIPDGVRREVRSEVEQVVVIEAQDGGREFVSSHVSESFAEGTTTEQAITFLIDQLEGIGIGNIDAIFGDISLPSLVLTGRVTDQIDIIAEMSGAQWGIRDRVAQFWKRGGTTGESAVVFSQEAGNLIDSSPTDDGVEVKGLIAPTLRPGKPFRVESDLITGDFVAQSVGFKGDSGWATEYYVTARGIPV